MSFVAMLLPLVADVTAKKIDFPTYKAGIESVLDQISQQSDADKARAFDEMFKTIRQGLTEQDEPYESGNGTEMWSDSDQTHYDWEAVMQAIFGKDFFMFYNLAYTGG